MPTTTSRSRTAHGAGRRPRLTALLAAIGLVIAGLVAAGPSFAAQPIAPTSIAVEVSTDLGVGEYAPPVLAKAGDDIDVLLTLEPAGATFTKNTALDLSVEGGTGTGTLTPSRVVFPKGTTSYAFTVTYSVAESGLRLKVSPAPTNGPATGLQQDNYSNTFDIQKSLLLAKAGSPALASGFGADACGQDSPEPLCGIAYLPNGITSEQAALAIAECTADLGCTEGSQVVSFLAGLGVYSHTDPATLVLRCDKTLCAGGGVNSYTVKGAKLASDPLEPVPACAVKGEVQEGEPFCIDYRQSHRDNAGDLLLYWLVTDDLRGII